MSFSILFIKHGLVIYSDFSFFIAVFPLLELLRISSKSIETIILTTLVKLLPLELPLSLLLRRVKHQDLLNEFLPKVNFLQLVAALSKHLVERVVVGLILEVSCSLEDRLNDIIPIGVHHKPLQKTRVPMQLLEH